MKNLTGLFILLICSVCVSAQITETKQQMSFGVQNGLTIYIENAESKLLDDIWKNYTKDFGKLKKNKKANELILSDVAIPRITTEKMVDVFAITVDNQITLFVDMKGVFLNSVDHPNEFIRAQTFLQEFAYEVQRELTKKELEREEDALKKLNKTLSNLIDNNKDYHKDIEDAREEIRKAEIKIMNNERDLEQTKALLASQTKTVEMIQEKLNNIGKK